MSKRLSKKQIEKAIYEHAKAIEELLNQYDKRSELSMTIHPKDSYITFNNQYWKKIKPIKFTAFEDDINIYD